VAQHLNFGRHIVELFTDIDADLGEYTAAVALALGKVKFMADLDPRQVRGELGTAGLAGAYLLIAQRVALSSGSMRPLR